MTKPHGGVHKQMGTFSKIKTLDPVHVILLFLQIARNPLEDLLFSFLPKRAVWETKKKKKIALCSNSVLDIFFLPKLPNYMPPMPIVNFPHRHNTMIKMLLLNDFFVILCPHGERLALFLDVGIQNEPPQDVPQWYMAYFEKKANKTLQVQKKLLLSS